MFKIIAVGTLKEKYLIDMINEYQKRLSKYVKLIILEAKEFNDTLPTAKEEEGKAILKLIKNTDYVISLTLKKNEYTSEEFAENIDSLLTRARSDIVFVIGGSLGLSNEVIKRSNECLTLSKMTFTHQMSRVILLEQLYRAFKINNNEKYHK